MRLQGAVGNQAVEGLLHPAGATVQRHSLPTMETVPAPLDLTDGGTTAPAGGTTTAAPATGGTTTTTAPATGGTTPAPAPAAATTLTATGPTAAYATAAATLQANWATLATADARGRALGQAAIDQLTAIGVHPPTVVMADLPAGNGGNFAFTTWSLTLSRLPFTAATPSVADINNVIEAAYHEARHCEQWFRMARLRAGAGRTAAQIATEMSGLAPAAAAAAHAAPIAAGSAEATQATVWWNSVYGTGAAHRSAVLTEVLAALGAYNTARSADAAASTPTTRTALTAAQTRFNTAYVAYQALPEEADAFATAPALRTALTAARAAAARAATLPATGTGTPPATGTGGP